MMIVTMYANQTGQRVDFGARVVWLKLTLFRIYHYTAAKFDRLL